MKSFALTPRKMNCSDEEVCMVDTRAFLQQEQLENTTSRDVDVGVSEGNVPKSTHRLLDQVMGRDS